MYDCHASGTLAKIKFTNDGIGGGKDTCYGTRKSGTVYYRVAGGSEVKQLGGQEREGLAFS